jgi:hypothetical protein
VKKKERSRKQKVSMPNLIVNQPSTPTIADTPTIENTPRTTFRSFIGRMLKFMVENHTTSPLEHAVSVPVAPRLGAITGINAPDEAALLRNLVVKNKKYFCPTCVERVELYTIDGVPVTLDRQGHYRPKKLHSCNTHLTDNFVDRKQAGARHYRTEARYLRDARRVELAATREREQSRLERVAEFEQLTEEGRKQHKVAWVKSFAGLFVHMMGRVTSVADCVVRIGDPTNQAPITDAKPRVVDYLLLPQSPRTCDHTSTKAFTLSTGETITLCSDCEKTTAHAILSVNNISKATEGFKALWDARLKALAVSLSSGWSTLNLEGGYQLCNDCGLVMVNGDVVCSRHDGHYLHLTCDPAKHPLDLSEDAYRIPTQWLKDDLSYLAGKDEQQIPHRVNTAGCTEHDGARADVSKRNRRPAKRPRKPLTQFICLWCGKEGYARKGTYNCPNTDHRQRLNEEIKDLIREILRFKELKELILSSLKKGKEHGDRSSTPSS